MAGGGYGRGAGIPLKGRVRVDSTDRSTSRPAAAAAGPEHPGRHCWVSVPVDAAHPRPGLLLEWRRAGHLWEGRVVYLAQLRPGRWATVEEWIPAELLTTE
ncbi:hypothetical protein [Nocardioides daphniae]|uniref:Uncharacterized protein n=1 Tax=Nocardioides daphniae TaxID=402297 RepID=A0A4P7U753_9ACTN|nr:hypothetical protein [Nocardioides daphniae]QCC76053.1 hypothetical protein E2C04_00525 [Nocardioides daphniae]GGD10676.1 hypothetical protein GCM10007231_06800 [Nocardioides daphniae]